MRIADTRSSSVCKEVQFLKLVEANWMSTSIVFKEYFMAVYIDCRLCYIVSCLNMGVKL